MPTKSESKMAKNTKNITDIKVGILGGGQLGKMLAIEAAKWHLPIYALDQSKDFPAGTISTDLVEGSFKNYDDVLRFGREMDVITIEIEHVNTDALLQLQKEGKEVHPNPQSLNIIKDKGLQKNFYKDHNIPTSPFELYENEAAVKKAIDTGALEFPFVQKSRTAGYDGRGVVVINKPSDLDRLLPGPCVIEDKVEIEKELAVIVAKNPSGQIEAFPVVDMEFNPVANLVEFLFCPAKVSAQIEKEAIELSKQVIAAYDICGLLAVELFFTKAGTLLVNEVAPRPHNSGHHTLDSCYTSQFEQHLRAILDLSLGSTKMKSPSVMVNLLGEDGYNGRAMYAGLDECLNVEGAKLHIYGKEMTKPFRKMGHITVLDETLEGAIEKAKQVKSTLKVIA